MEMDFERTTDLNLVREILTHPKIYPRMIDDFSPPAEDFIPVEHERVWYVLVRDGGEILGLWMVVFVSPILAEIHTCLLPHAWGERAAIAAKEAIRWLFAHSELQRIFTHVPAFNRLALRFAKASGMTEFGRHPKSFLFDGILHDQFMLGLSRGEENS